MKPPPLSCLSAALAAAGISASLYFFSVPVSTTFPPPNEAIPPGRKITSSVPVSFSAASGRGAHDFRPIHAAIFDEVKTGSGQTSGAQVRALSRPQREARNLSAAETNSLYQAQHSTRQEGLVGSGDERQEPYSVEDQVSRAQGKDVAVLNHPRSSISMKLSQQRLVAGSRTGYQERQGTDNVSTQSELNPATLPAVLVPPSSVEGMTELQATEWTKLEEAFVTDIGSPHQSPSDPEYRARWQTAQEISDAMFRQKFGTEAFLRFNAEAGRRIQ